MDGETWALEVTDGFHSFAATEVGKIFNLELLLVGIEKKNVRSDLGKGKGKRKVQVRDPTARLWCREEGSSDAAFFGAFPFLCPCSLS